MLITDNFYNSHTKIDRFLNITSMSNRNSVSPARITITTKGRTLQKEMLKELKTEETSRTHSSRNHVLSPFYLVNPNTHQNREITAGNTSLLEGNSSARNDVSRSYMSRSKESERIKLPRVSFRPELERVPYIRRKLEKLNADISRLGSRADRSFNLDTSGYVNPTDNSYLNSHFLDQSANRQLSAERRGRSFDLNGKLTAKSYLKILHVEHDSERLIHRHERNLRIINRIQEDVSRKCQQDKHAEWERTRKRPELLDGLRETHPEAVDALFRETKVFQRRKHRIREKALDKYQKAWNQFRDLSKQKQ